MYCPHEDYDNDHEQQQQPETDSRGSKPHDELSSSTSSDRTDRGGGGAAAVVQVKFNLWEEVHEVPNAKSLSNNEFHDIWYDPMF